MTERIRVIFEKELQVAGEASEFFGLDGYQVTPEIARGDIRNDYAPPPSHFGVEVTDVLLSGMVIAGAGVLKVAIRALCDCYIAKVSKPDAIITILLRSGASISVPANTPKDQWKKYLGAIEIDDVEAVIVKG